MTTPEKFDQWAIVEVMGHQKYAGRVTEQTLGGAAFIRIDVPDIQLLKLPAVTKLFGPASIYAITPVTEEVARHIAAKLGHTPITVWDLPEEIRDKIRSVPALTAADDDDYDDDIPC